MVFLPQNGSYYINIVSKLLNSVEGDLIYITIMEIKKYSKEIQA